jgi:hypothetical protein
MAAARILELFVRRGEGFGRERDHGEGADERGD